MPACPTLLTERLTLRPFRADDLEPLHAVMTTDEVRDALHVAGGYGRGDAWASLTSYAGLWELRGFGQWALEVRDSGRFVGRAGLYWRVEPEWPGVEVGWMLDPASWGLGYATEAGARAARFGFEDLGVDALYCVVLPENTRSQAVARRLGFERFDQRVLPWFPSQPHEIWRLDRTDGAGTGGPGHV